MSNENSSTQEKNLEREIHELDVATPEQFTITDAKSANWVVRRIVEARAYAQAVDEWAEDEKKRCADVEAFFLDRYGVQLEEFARIVIREQNEHFKHDLRQSIKLPAGTLGFRVQAARVRVIDEQAVIEWCQRYLPVALRTSQRVSRTTINEYFQTTGNLPGGTLLDGERDHFYIR